MVKYDMLVTVEIDDEFKKIVAFECKDLKESTIKSGIEKCTYALYNKLVAEELLEQNEERI